MSGLASALREIELRNAPEEAVELDLVKAAKCVVALSGWTKTPEGREVYQSSYFAMEVLRKAIEEHENPVLRLAPEGIPPGRV